jgi:uncharacterized protein YlbG (UPF0298 family)
LRSQDGFKIGDVVYRSIPSIEAIPPKLEELPFVKRVPYTDENEFRIIYVNRNKVEKIKVIPLDLLSIRRVTLSPWLSEEVGRTVAKVIRDIDGCGHLKVARSTLLENERWKNAVSATATRRSRSES